MKRDETPTPSPGHQKASAALTAALGTLSYPISKEAAIEAIGTWKIGHIKDVPVALGNMLKGVPDEEFRDVSHAARALDQHWGRMLANLDAMAAVEAKAKGKKAKR